MISGARLSLPWHKQLGCGTQPVKTASKDNGPCSLQFGDFCKLNVYSLLGATFCVCRYWVS